MPKLRAFGADCQMLLAFEDAYGVAPDGGAGGVYRRMPFKDSTLGVEQPLGYDPLLGQGDEAQDPHYEAIVDDGQIGVPIDLRNIGVWLKGLLGPPATTGVPATGSITFAAIPEAGDTIALNGTAWTFVGAGAGADETTIQATLADTLAQIAQDLNASADPEVAKCTYTATASELEIAFQTPGAAGNSFTIAASAAQVSGPTLMGGGHRHVWTSGGEVPSATIEIGHVGLAVPRFARHFGARVGELTFDMGRGGPANAAVRVIAQGESNPAAAADADPVELAVHRFHQGGGSILLGGERLGKVTAGQLAFSNGLEPDETIRDDDLIDGVDATERTATGSMTVRFTSDATLKEAGKAKAPVALEYRYGMPGAGGFFLAFALPRVFLPRKKEEIRGPAGIDVAYEWRAAKDPAAGHLLGVTLKNDVAGY